MFQLLGDESFDTPEVESIAKDIEAMGHVGLAFTKIFQSSSTDTTGSIVFIGFQKLVLFSK